MINFEFKFDNVFKESTSQETVFNKAAVSVVEGTTKRIALQNRLRRDISAPICSTDAGFLNGYNGTIFAYGQTGSGKTFTVEGHGRKAEARGLAPR